MRFPGRIRLPRKLILPQNPKNKSSPGGYLKSFYSLYTVCSDFCLVFSFFLNISIFKSGIFGVPGRENGPPAAAVRPTKCGVTHWATPPAAPCLIDSTGQKG